MKAKTIGYYKNVQNVGDVNAAVDLKVGMGVVLNRAARTANLPASEEEAKACFRIVSNINDKPEMRNFEETLTVKAGENAAKIQRIYQISVNSDWVLGTDYTLDVKVTSADNQVRAAAPGRTVSGKGQSWEKTYDSCIFVVGDTVQATVTPDPVARPTFNTATAKKTPTMNDSLSAT